jgi:NAD(P)-dependent dehydrogenase (short-subunit alcohol dehydrogenase family)
MSSPWVLVSGGAQRLGREICLAFAKAGWSIVCHYRHSEERAKALCKELESLAHHKDAPSFKPIQAHPLYAELGNEQSCRKLFDQASELSNYALQCIVNNASLFLPDEAYHFNEDQVLDQLKVNLLAPMHFGKWLYAQKNTSHKSPSAHNNKLGNDLGINSHTSPEITPSLIHILDQKVFNLNPDYYSYSVSKLALERLVALQAQSLAPKVRVNAVAPGLLYPSGPQNLENFQKASLANLMKTPIAPHQVANSVLFLAENPCITGTSLKVDNGQHLVPTERDIMFVVDELIGKNL